MNKMSKRAYPYWFVLPAAVVYLVIFILPTLLSFFFSMTRWTLFDWEFIGMDNFIMFFKEASLMIGFKNTFIYAIVTCVAKVVLGLLLAVALTSKLRTKNYLRSVVFFPTLVSTIAVGIAFSMMMHPTKGLINKGLNAVGLPSIDWLGNPDLALYSVALTDIWKGLGFATVIYIAGIMSISKDYYEALEIDGGNSIQKFWNIIVPLSRPATNTVIIFAFIGGLRTFDLIWAMTKGGPGYATDLIASIIYKQYQAGFYGLSTAGNVILFLFVTLLVFPLNMYLNRKEVDL